MSVGVIVHGLDDAQRREAYAADITYGTNNEFGFDYLRDNMKYDMSQMVQRGHPFAIVDEVELDPGRRSAHAADHFRPVRGPLRPLRRGRQADPAPRARRLRHRRKAAHGQPDRSRQRACRGDAARGRRAEGRLALRGRQRDAGPPRQSGAARPQAVPARQGLHRAQRRGRHRRRVHRPHDAGPALFGRPASGARSQGARDRPARERDARLDHLPELFPPLREARRHDRHGVDRGRRIRRNLQAHRRRDSDPSPGLARRRGRRGLSHGRREAARGGARDRGRQRQTAADAGRHDLDREVRAARRATGAARLQEDRLHRAAMR